MKYIRTKDGRIIAVDADKALSWYYSEKRGSFEKIIEIINQANTIEELCDEFVVITNEYRKIGSLYECEYLISAFKKKIKSNNPIIAIYGAIWTDKGLIYVAKMNGKGELELL